MPNFANGTNSPDLTLIDSDLQILTQSVGIKNPQDITFSEPQISINNINNGQVTDIVAKRGTSQVKGSATDIRYMGHSLFGNVHTTTEDGVTKLFGIPTHVKKNYIGIKIWISIT